MAIFTAIAATFNYLVWAGITIVGTGGAVALAGIYASAALITGAIVFGVSKGIGKALMPDFPTGTTGNNAGTRVQLAPNTGYRVPVSYGHSYSNGIVTDAAITTDNQTMTYVLTISEKTTGTTTVGNIYWNDKLLSFNGTTQEVTSSTDDDGTTSTDMADNVEVYVWDDTTQLRGDGSAPHTLVSHWTDSSYRNTGTVFAIVKITYDPEAQLTGLGTMTFELNNSLDNPADVLEDYLESTIYGAGIPSSSIDSTSLTTLRTYSDVLIDYTDSNGAAATQKRYTINGIANTAEDVRTNIDRLLTACNCFFTYDAKQGKWKVSPNKAEDTAAAFQFNDDNILGELKFSATALDGAYNSVEVEFPDSSQKDKNNYVTIDLPANLRETNEPDNQMSIRMEYVNNSVQASYLANQQLRQTRDDQVVMFTADYTTLGVDAGDVVKLYETEIYGQNDKLYRVVQTVEKENDQGMLTIDFTCIEYNADVYTVEPITEFTPAPNSDIALFNRLGTPTTPTVDNERSLLSLPAFDVNTNTPASGIYTRAEVWFDTNSNMSTKKLLSTFRSPTTIGTGTEVEFTITGLASGTYYYQTRAGNDAAFGPYSSTSSAHNWTANVLINPITIIDGNEPVLTATNGKLVVNTGSIGTTYLSPAVNTALSNAGAGLLVPTYNYFTTTNAAAPSDSVFNTRVGRDPLANDVVVATKSGDVTVQKAYIHDGTSFVENTNFFSGGLVTDGTIGADAIVANSISTGKLDFTPVQTVAGQSGSSISTTSLKAGGMRLTTDAVATSLLNGTVGTANGGTGRTSTSSYVNDLKASGMRLTADVVSTGLLSGTVGVSNGGTGQTSTASYVADLSAAGLRLTSQTVATNLLTGTVSEANGGTGQTTLDAALTAEGVRFTSQTIPFSEITGTVPQGQGGTGSTSFASALTAQGVGFVSGSNANLGALATLNNVNLSQVTDSGTLAGLNAAVLGTNTSGTLPEGQGGTGQTSDSAYASHLSSQGLIVTEVAGSTGSVSAATIIAAGSIAVIGQNVSDFTNNSGFIPGSAVNTNVTAIDGGVITTGLINTNRINAATLYVTNFADVNSGIISQTGSAVRLSEKGFYYSAVPVTGTGYPYTVGNQTISGVRNGGSWTAILTGVFGNVQGVRVQYSYNNSNWFNAPQGSSPFSWNTGSYRPYTYTYAGTISGLTSAQSTLYTRVYFFGNKNYTQIGLTTLVDNTN
jgi:hypothetical protein|tara:strand:+ start:9915 stop:13556 length:3642 start_codon:yes stop_codon:yes gene_type:complete